VTWPSHDFLSWSRDEAEQQQGGGKTFVSPTISADSIVEVCVVCFLTSLTQKFASPLVSITGMRVCIIAVFEYDDVIEFCRPPHTKGRRHSFAYVIYV